jgi:hypothetical protein
MVWEGGVDEGRYYSWSGRVKLMRGPKAARAARQGAAAHPGLRSYGETAFCLCLSVTALAVTATFASDAYYPIRNRSLTVAAR